MALPQTLTDVLVKIDGTTVINCKKVTIDNGKEPRDRTSFGNVARNTGSGLPTWTITLEFFLDFAAGSAIWPNIVAKEGTNVAVVIEKDSTAAISVTNPRWEATGHLLEVPLEMEAGADNMITLTFESAGTVISVLTVS